METSALRILHNKIVGDQSVNISKNEAVLNTLAVFVKICKYLSIYADVLEALFDFKILGIYVLRWSKIAKRIM